MPFDHVPSNLPAVAIVLGALVLLWSQRERLAPLWAIAARLLRSMRDVRVEREVPVVADGYRWTGPTSAYVCLYEQTDSEARAVLKRELWPAVHRAVFGPDDADGRSHQTNGATKT